MSVSYPLINKTVNCFKLQLEKLKAELDEARLSEKQLKHKVDHQKELLSHKSEEMRVMSERAHETMSSEVLALQTELTEMESVKVIVTTYMFSGFLTLFFAYFLHVFVKKFL